MSPTLQMVRAKLALAIERHNETWRDKEAAVDRYNDAWETVERLEREDKALTALEPSAWPGLIG